jgi:ankyrin repeat protein
MLQAQGTLRTALHSSILRGIDETSKLIIATALNVDVPDANGVTALIMACKVRGYARQQLIQPLLDRGANINAVDKTGESVLGLACKAGRTLVVREFLHRGASLDQEQQRFNQTPIYYACQRGYAEILTLLMDHGATVNSSKRPLENQLFVAAVGSGSKVTTKLLMESDPAHFMFAKSRTGESALHIACKMGLSSVLVQWLVDVGAENDGVDKDERSALHHAVLAGNDELVHILLNAKVDINIKDKNGLTALDLAMQHNNIKAVVGMIERMYVLDMNGNSPLHFASAIDNVKILEECFILNKTKYSGRLITVHDLNHKGESALHIATEKRLLHTIEFLLDHGADVNIQNSKTGDTPLHHAATGHWEGGIVFLLEKGADRKIANAQGLLPRDIAVRNGKRISQIRAHRCVTNFSTDTIEFRTRIRTREGADSQNGRAKDGKKFQIGNAG